ncbi:hypothetical protein ACWGFX_37755 [Streptomyces xanthophaeus]
MDGIVLLKEDHRTVEKLFMENVRHHVEEEEWFPDVRKVMGRNRLTRLGEQKEAAKKRAPSEPLAVPSAKH